MNKLTYNNTPETMSVEEAVKLFKPLENDAIYKSYALMEKVVPKEYMDNENFFKQIIPIRFAITYDTLISYASYRLKANEELAMDSIIQNRSVCGLYETYLLPLTEEQKKELEANKQYIITEKQNDKLIVKSKLLEDKKFIKKVAETAKQLTESAKDTNSFFYWSLVQHSKEFASNEQYMKQAVSQRPDLYRYYIGENTEEVVLKAVETMFENGRFATYINEEFYDKQSKDVKKLLTLCKKIGDLPKDAKIRKSIYKKICNRYMSKIDENIDEMSLY